MLDTLISDIKEYIQYLAEQGLYVSVHTAFNEYMLPLIEYNIHKNPVCLIVKSDNDKWDECVKIHSEYGKTVEIKECVCTFGVKETVFPLECGGTVCVSGKGSFENVKRLINPLCRMIEYLKMISPESRDEISENEMVNRIIKYVQRNFYNKITNEMIANACFCSVSTVCHLFKKTMGICVGEYVFKLRINYAKELLKTSNLSIASIANKCGFSDYNYFAYRFKKTEKMTPGEYRHKSFTNGIKSDIIFDTIY